MQLQMYKHCAKAIITQSELVANHTVPVLTILGQGHINCQYVKICIILAYLLSGWEHLASFIQNRPSTIYLDISVGTQGSSHTGHR